MRRCVDDPTEWSWGLWHTYLLVLDSTAAVQGQHVELVVDPLFSEQFVVATARASAPIRVSSAPGRGEPGAPRAGAAAAAAQLAPGSLPDGQLPSSCPTTAPAVFVGSPWELRAAVTQLSEEVAAAFAAAGRQLPPWRTATVALGRWFGTCVTDLSVPLAEAAPGEWDSFRAAAIALATAGSNPASLQGARHARRCRLAPAPPQLPAWLLRPPPSPGAQPGCHCSSPLCASVLRGWTLLGNVLMPVGRCASHVHVTSDASTGTANLVAPHLCPPPPPTCRLCWRERFVPAQQQRQPQWRQRGQRRVFCWLPLRCAAAGLLGAPRGAMTVVCWVPPGVLVVLAFA